MTRRTAWILTGAVTGATVLLPAAAEARKLPPRTGGSVQAAWPKTHSGQRGKAPKQALARWLARQVGPRKVLPRAQRKPRPRGLSPSAARTLRLATASAAGTTRASVAVPVAHAAATAQKLSLVRSFDIPSDDPSYARLLNLSFTYDSAIGAVAFMAADNRSQAQQLLDQLAALQRTDGSLELAYDTSTGVGTTQFRTGTMAWVGLAAEVYKGRYGSSRYDVLAERAAKWLLDQRADSGLLTGGPDVSWVSTQNNIVAGQFLGRFGLNAAADGGSATPTTTCVWKRADGTYVALMGSTSDAPVTTAVARGLLNKLSTGDGAQPARFAPGTQDGTFTVPFTSSVTWTLNGRSTTATTKSRACASEPVGTPAPAGPTAGELVSAATTINDTVVTKLRVGNRFVQGVGDTVLPTDVQALGALLLRQRGDVLGALAVAAQMSADARITGRTVVTSKDTATYNMTYGAKGPFVGFRPYSSAGAPDVLWFEWTAEARVALDRLALIDLPLAASMASWLKITSSDNTGPLGADKTVTTSRFNEFHVWPTSAAGSWSLIQQEDPAIVLP